MKKIEIEIVQAMSFPGMPNAANYLYGDDKDTEYGFVALPTGEASNSYCQLGNYPPDPKAWLNYLRENPEAEVMEIIGRVGTNSYKCTNWQWMNSILLVKNGKSNIPYGDRSGFHDHRSNLWQLIGMRLSFIQINNLKNKITDLEKEKERLKEVISDKEKEQERLKEVISDKEKEQERLKEVISDKEKEHLRILHAESDSEKKWKDKYYALRRRMRKLLK